MIINLDEYHENADWLKPSKDKIRDQDEPLKEAATEAPAPNGSAAEHNEDSE